MAVAVVAHISLDMQHLCHKNLTELINITLSYFYFYVDFLTVVNLVLLKNITTWNTGQLNCVWDKANIEHIDAYKCNLDKRLSEIKMDNNWFY